MLAFVTVVLLVAPVSARSGSAVTYWGDNAGSAFVRAVGATDFQGDGYAIHQQKGYKGSFVMSAAAEGAAGETSAGLVIVVGWAPFGSLRSITILPSELDLTGSAVFAVNLWIDANPADNAKANGPFFAWDGRTLTGLGGDIYALGPGVKAGGGTSLFVDLSTTFFVIGGAFGGTDKTVAELEALYGGAAFGLWIGIDIAGSSTGTGSVTLPPLPSLSQQIVVE